MKQKHSTVSHTCLCLKMSSSKFACSVSACEIHQILPEAEKLLLERASLTVHIMFWDPSVLPKILSYSSLSWVFSTCEGLSCWQRHCWAFWIAKRKPNENMKLKYGTAHITLQGTNNLASYGKGMVPTTSSKKGFFQQCSCMAPSIQGSSEHLLHIAERDKLLVKIGSQGKGFRT